MRCVIVGAASINDYETTKSFLSNNDFYIFCDAGLKHAEKLNITPNLIIGDFDSYSKPETNIETITLPCEKDDTDTVFAVKEGIKRDFDDFLLIGVVGERLDHTICNVSILNFLDNHGKNGKILDDYSEMVIVSNKTEYIDNKFSFFSLINIFGTSEGIYVNNAKYPLDNATITSDYQYGVSNEVLPNKTAEVRIKKGKLLLIKVR